jgi:hypothetical protein
VLPNLPFLPVPSTPVAFTAHVKNVSGRPFRAQDHAGPAGRRLGAQLTDANGVVINRDHARAWLPAISRRAIGRRAHRSHRARETGTIWLKFDLVSEGIDWFESCGSPTITRGLWVS